MPQGKSLFDARADSLAEVNGYTLADILIPGEAKALVDIMAHRLALLQN